MKQVTDDHHLVTYTKFPVISRCDFRFNYMYSEVALRSYTFSEIDFEVAA